METLPKVNASRRRSSIEEDCSQRHTETLISLEDELIAIQENERRVRDELALLATVLGGWKKNAWLKIKELKN